ncbi:unnamed protein product [Durusdinium trenchii]|uniref:Uncharacterized protein n=1 Tax=Durusdinium trenchii TaxID=1381693 RepID=A0ABP0I2Z1_9DINO
MAFLARATSRLGFSTLLTSQTQVRHFLAGPQVRLAHRAPQFTEDQIEQIRQHDAVLAEQIRKARDAGVKMTWKERNHWPLLDGHDASTFVKLQASEGPRDLIEPFKVSFKD